MIQIVFECTVVISKLKNKVELKKLNGMKVVDVAKKLKTTDRDVKHILSYCGVINIIHKVSILLEDMDFLPKINLQSDMMPIRNELIVNLQTIQCSPEHNFIFECLVKVDKDPAKYKLVEKFMLDICYRDKNLFSYIHIALGYSITEQVSEKTVFIWQGEKEDNSESILMNLLS